MPIISFQRSRNNAFVKSRGHARNPGRSPSGIGVITMASESIGFPFYTDAGGTIDPLQWFSEADVIETRLTTSNPIAYATNRFRMRYPAYYEIANSAGDALLNGAHEVVINGFPTNFNFNGVFGPPTTTTFAGPTMRREWKVPFGAGELLTYSSETTATGTPKTWTQLIEGVEAVFPEYLTFPASGGGNAYWLDATGVVGAVTVGGGTVPQWGFEILANTGYDFKIFSGATQVRPLGGTSIVFFGKVLKEKRRYRSQIPASLYATRLTAINNLTQHPITIFDPVSLPAGMDVCEPDSLSPELLAALPTCIPGRRVGSLGQKFVVPPDAIPTP